MSSLAVAQQQAAGVVTGIQGQAQLTRPAATPSALKFKDGVVIRDVVDTREKSLARILFGGRSTVTVRELSRLEVREELLPTGARRDVHDLSSGAILGNVARQLMRPGDEVQIRTPNAVAAVRGSTVFGSYNPVTQASFFAILSGFGLITPVGLQPITVTANTQNNGANVSGTGPGVQANVVNVPPGQVNQILAESQVGKAVKEEANKEQVAEAAAKEAAALANVVIETVTKSEQQSERQQTTTSESTTSSNTAPVTANTSSSSSTSSQSSSPKGLITFDPVFPNIPAGVTVQYFNGGLTGPLAALPTPNAVALVPNPSAIPGGGNALSLVGPCLGGCGVLLTFATPQQTVSAVGNDFGGDPVFDNEVVHLTAFNSAGNVIGTSTFSSPFATPNLKPVSFTSGSANIAFVAFTFQNDIGFYLVDDIDPPSPSSTFAVQLSDSSSMTYMLPEPYIQVSNTTVGVAGDLVSISNNTTLSLPESLLSATNTDLTIGGSLLAIFGGGQLTTSSASPVVLLDGGTYNIQANLFSLSGVNTDPTTGLGTDEPISGPSLNSLLKATNGAEVNAGGSALVLDTALLQATAPIIDLIGSPNKESALTTGQSTIDLIKSRMTSTGPVVAMDKSFINVTNGALINLTYGSNMIVTGDLISMFSGSKINVVNGPLISVAGVGSLLDVSGALVNFGGTGGNKIVVNNSIAPTATLSGLPVSATFGGSVNISNPIKNPSLGSITVNGTLISATNGGTVNIQGK